MAHPHHGLFYTEIYRRLVASGHDVVVASRDKDVTLNVLDASDVPHVCVSRKRREGNLSDLMEGLVRVTRLIRMILRTAPDTVLTSNPTGCIAARLARRPAVFDTMDGPSHGAHFLLGAHLADFITSPQLLGLVGDERYVAYPALKSMSHAIRDPVATQALFRDLGIKSTATVSVLRVSAYTASHDRGATGLTADFAPQVLGMLMSRFDHVVVSAEGGGLLVDDPVSDWLRRHPGTFHRFLERADLVVGDSVTVAEESVILGTPSIWISEFALDRPIAQELEARFHVTRNIMMEDDVVTCAAVEVAIDELMSDEQRSLFLRGHRELMNSSTDVAQWYCDFIVKKFKTVK